MQNGSNTHREQKITKAPEKKSPSIKELVKIQPWWYYISIVGY